jgi:ABC-type nitrate/sulfonate/bicarbonate transport system substrate-binding protein
VNEYDAPGPMPMRPQLRRRGALFAAALICTGLCAGCGEVHARLGVGPPRPLTVALAGPPSALYAPLYTADADGDFHLGALAVTITTSPDPLAALESGRAGVAIASEPALLAARAAGAQLVAIGALVGEPLDGIVSLAARPIVSPSALGGATIAVAPTALAQAEIVSVLAAAHPAGVQWASTSGEVASALLSGRFKAALSERWPLTLAGLEVSHHPAAVLELQQAGVPSYSGLVIVVRIGEAHYDGALLRAFLQSLTRGQRAVAANPAAAAATLARLNPALSVAVERTAIGELLPLATPSGTGNPFGYQKPSAWQTFGVWMRVHGLAAASANAGLAITDEFLPGEGEHIVTTS